MKNRVKKSHLEMLQIVLHVSFVVTVDGLGRRTETTFSSSLMADRSLSFSAVKLSNYIFCCIPINFLLYSGIVIWEVHAHTLPQLQLITWNWQQYVS